MSKRNPSAADKTSHYHNAWSPPLDCDPIEFADEYDAIDYEVEYVQPDQHFTEHELSILALSDTDAYNCRNLTGEMIQLRQRREFITSVLPRHDRGRGHGESRLGNPRRGKYTRERGPS